MGRPLRIEYPGALYHITSRGNEKREIFRDDGDRKKFCEVLADYHDRFNVYIHSFVLMKNHYHLILETPQANLLKVMHGINGKYTGYFNRKYGRNGHLFQGRYKGILVDKDAYLLQLSRYVHLNPVKAGIIDKPERYEWSSYPGFIGKGKKYGWVEYSWILGQFGPNEQKALQEYKRFVDAGLEEAHDSLFSDVQGQVILGDETFVEKARSLLAGRQLSREIVNRNNLQLGPQPEKIIAAVADKYGVEEKRITEPGAKKNTARKIAMYLVHQYSGIGNNEIGKQFGGIHYTAVSKTVARLKQEIYDGKDYGLTDLLDRLKSNVKT